MPKLLLAASLPVSRWYAGSHLACCSSVKSRPVRPELHACMHAAQTAHTVMLCAVLAAQLLGRLHTTQACCHLGMSPRHMPHATASGVRPRSHAQRRTQPQGHAPQPERPVGLAKHSPCLAHMHMGQVTEPPRAPPHSQGVCRRDRLLRGPRSSDGAGARLAGQLTSSSTQL